MPAVADSAEIKSTVEEVVDGAVVQWDHTNFAGFYYDYHDEIGTEQITMTITDDVLDEPNGVIYETVAQQDDLDFEEWGVYWTIPFLAEEFFAAYVEDGAEAHLAEDSTDTNLMVDGQLSKVLMDEDEEMIITKKAPLKLAEGYELSIKGIDEYGNVWLDLAQAGKIVDSSILAPSAPYATISDKTYTYAKDIGATEEIVIIAVHFKGTIFHGSGTNLQDSATIDGIWQISETPTIIEEDSKYDKMTVQTVNADCLTIMMNNEDNAITLVKGQNIQLMDDIWIGTTAETPLGLYIYKKVTKR